MLHYKLSWDWVSSAVQLVSCNQRSQPSLAEAPNVLWFQLLCIVWFGSDLSVLHFMSLMPTQSINREHIKHINCLNGDYHFCHHWNFYESGYFFFLGGGAGRIPIYPYLAIYQTSCTNQVQSPLLWFGCLICIQIHFATMIQDFNPIWLCGANQS